MVRQQLNNVKTVLNLYAELCGGLDIFLAVIELGDNGITNLQSAAGLYDFLGILEDELIRHANQLFAALGVHVLEVIKEQIYIGQNLHIALGGSKTRCIESYVEAFFAALLGKSESEIKLAHGFTAGDGYAAAGLLIILLVLANGLHAIFNGHAAQGIVKRGGGTCLDALKTSVALGAVDNRLSNFIVTLESGLEGTFGNRTAVACLHAHCAVFHANASDIHICNVRA